MALSISYLLDITSIRCQDTEGYVLPQLRICEKAMIIYQCH